MNPLIGFRTETANAPHGHVAEIRPAAAVAAATGAVAVGPSLSAADYAYRIAALTAGLTFLATFV
jgi:hypothetical protein